MYLQVSPHHSAVACCVLVLGASSAVPDGQTDRDTCRDRHPQPGVTVPPHHLWSLSTTGHPRALKPNFGGISASSPTVVPVPQSPLWLSSIDAIGSSYKAHGDLPALYKPCSSCRPCWQPWLWVSGGRNRDQPSGVKKPQILQSLTAGGAAWSLSQFLLISLSCSPKNVFHQGRGPRLARGSRGGMLPKSTQLLREVFPHWTSPATSSGRDRRRGEKTAQEPSAAEASAQQMAWK